MTAFYVALGILLAFNILAAIAGEWRYVGATLFLTVVCGGWVVLVMTVQGNGPF